MLEPCIAMSLSMFCLGLLTGLSVRFTSIRKGIRTQAEIVKRNVKVVRRNDEIFTELKTISAELDRRERVVREAERALGVEQNHPDS